MSVASREVTEAIADPQLTAWHNAAGHEIGDKCARIHGVNSYDNSKANPYCNGRYHEPRLEFNNHTDPCAQTGPN